MSDTIVVGKSAQEFFKDLVAETITYRQLKVREQTEFYLVSLLARRVVQDPPAEAGGGSDPEPLAFILKRALEGDRHDRWRHLKRLGDTALFVSGFFGDSLAGSLVDLDYYVAMGERAYDALSEEPRAFSGAHETFGELAERFEQFVDLFAEIAELSELKSNRGLLRLYERFLLTRSERVAQLLRERGVALFAGPGPSRGGYRQ